MQNFKTGLVIKAIAGSFYIEYENEILECKSSTKLKKNGQKILPGDNVIFDLDNNYIKEIKPRSSQLIRPQIANVHHAILVFSLTNPKMNFGLLDRMLMIMEYNNLKSIILLTKKDLLTEEQFTNLLPQLNYYQNIGYQLLYNLEIKTPENLLEQLEVNKKYVLTGQSGVGKSTFLNSISTDLNIKTQEISKALGRGKHTTRETTFYKIKNNYLIDTPGFSALNLNLSKEEIRDSFIDFKKLAIDCKFNSCYHINEPDCAVKKALEQKKVLAIRYKNYLKLMEEK